LAFQNIAMIADSKEHATLDHDVPISVERAALFRSRHPRTDRDWTCCPRFRSGFALGSARGGVSRTRVAIRGHRRSVSCSTPFPMRRGPIGPTKTDGAMARSRSSTLPAGRAALLGT
jgi:hypothetical protein